MNKLKPLLRYVPHVFIMLLLLWALNPENPYAYYRIMRVIVCTAYAYLFTSAIGSKKKEWAWVLGVLAFIYNPIVSLHLNREIWTVINVVSILITVLHIWCHRNLQSE